MECPYGFPTVNGMMGISNIPLFMYFLTELMNRVKQ